ARDRRAEPPLPLRAARPRRLLRPPRPRRSRPYRRAAGVRPRDVATRGLPARQALDRLSPAAVRTRVLAAPRSRRRLASAAALAFHRLPSGIGGAARATSVRASEQVLASAQAAHPEGKLANPSN